MQNVKTTLSRKLSITLSCWHTTRMPHPSKQLRTVQYITMLKGLATPPNTHTHTKEKHVTTYARARAYFHVCSGQTTGLYYVYATTNIFIDFKPISLKIPLCNQVVCGHTHAQKRLLVLARSIRC